MYSVFKNIWLTLYVCAKCFIRSISAFLCQVLARLWRRRSCPTSAPPLPSFWTPALGTRTARVPSATRTCWNSPATASSSTHWWVSSRSQEIWTLQRAGSTPSCKSLCVGWVWSLVLTFFFSTNTLTFPDKSFINMSSSEIL